jgi:hypothetical protein
MNLNLNEIFKISLSKRVLLHWLTSLVMFLLKVTRQHKIGILYCKAGQSTEEEMYNNGKVSGLQ